MSTVTRPVSVLRRLVPFKFECCGPVAEVTRQILTQFPHIFPEMLSTLERLDTAAEPRILFAEAIHRLVDENVRQSQVRAAFDEAEIAARQEFFLAHYDSKRCEFDFNYRLDSLQLVGAVQYWARMLRIAAHPQKDALTQLTHLYTADARRDSTMKGFVEWITHQHERDNIRANKHKQRFLEDCLILERDIFGPYRLDMFSNRKFVFHCIDLEELQRNDETYGMLTDIDAFETHGNFEVTEREIHGGRWKEIEVRCCAEEPESPPWSTKVFNELLGRAVDVHFDEPLVGRPQTVDKRIKVDNTVYPKTSCLNFDLAVPEEDQSFMGRLWRKRYDSEQGQRSDLWNQEKGGHSFFKKFTFGS